MCEVIPLRYSQLNGKEHEVVLGLANSCRSLNGCQLPTAVKGSVDRCLVARDKKEGEKGEDKGVQRPMALTGCHLFHSDVI